MARVFAAGGWYDAGTIDCTDATHKGVTIQFGGGPHPQDWYGTLDAVAAGRLDTSPSVGRTIGLDEVPDAIDQVRRARGPHALSSIPPRHERGCLARFAKSAMSYAISTVRSPAGRSSASVHGSWMRGLPMRVRYRGEPCEIALLVAWSEQRRTADSS